ncbi:MAG TPA: hypothetical protein VK463_15930 [Desulfomonilaceae bacterium]|nr:hypothetical protein [Desulfomonilaceae bacterium]
MIDNRFYNINGIKWEARFFGKGEIFPETEVRAPKQGIWARPVDFDWESAVFLGGSWRFIRLDSDVVYLPERK